MYGLFSLKLVRIKSLPRDPLWTAEVGKHDWSRSGTSPQGKKELDSKEPNMKDLRRLSVSKNPTDCCANIKYSRACPQ